MARYIYPGNHSYLALDDFLNKLARTKLDLVELFNDSWSYFLTFRQWALNLEKNKGLCVQGVRRVRISQVSPLPMALVYQFQARHVECYRMTLYKPKTAS